jgi:DNA polymerase III sliding clamp (beta) subunit (PCNA family)
MSKTIRITQHDLKDAFKILSCFTSKEETRYYLCGVFAEFKGDDLLLVATDGHTLCQIKPLFQIIDEGANWSGIIPNSAIKNLITICKGAKDETDGGVLISIEDNKMNFRFPDQSYACGLIDGTYPDYTKVIPAGEQTLGHNFQAKFLKNAINAFNKEPLNIAFDNNAENSAHLITSDRITNTKVVLMPMRV